MRHHEYPFNFHGRGVSPSAVTRIPYQKTQQDRLPDMPSKVYSPTHLCINTLNLIDEIGESDVMAPAKYVAIVVASISSAVGRVLET